jgi:hypothetical protein
MAGDKIPTYETLEKPEKFKEVLRRDRGDDCLSCRLVGTYHSHAMVLVRITQAD